MIGTKDIEQILIRDLAGLLDVDSIFVEDDTPLGMVTRERITIHCKGLRTRTYFRRCFVEVNWCVPDLTDGVPDSARLQQVERTLLRALDGNVGEFDSTVYRYGVESSSVHRSDLGCHYANVRLLFETLNVL